MRYFTKLLSALCLCTCFSISLFGQLPVLYGLQKITTADPDTFFLAGQQIIVNGQDTLGSWDPNLDPDFFNLVEADVQNGRLLNQAPLDSAKGVRYGCSTYDPWNQNYVALSENAYPSPGQIPYALHTQVVQYLHLKGIQGGFQSRNATQLLSPHISPQYDAQKQKIYACSQAFNPSNAYTFVEIDPLTGNFTPLMDFPDLWGPARAASTYDSNHGIYYLIGVDSTPPIKLFRIQTDSLTIEQVPVDPNVVWLDLEYDVNTNQLYGINGLNILDSMQLVSLNPQTGVSSTVASIPPYQVRGTAGYDFASGIYLFSSGAYRFGTPPRLLGIDVATGNYVIDTVLQDWMYEWQVDNSEFIQSFYATTTDLDAGLSAGMVIFPQPAGERLNVRLPKRGEGVYQLYDIQGKRVARGTFKEAKFVLPLGDLPSGVYGLQVVQADRAYWEKVLHQ